MSEHQVATAGQAALLLRPDLRPLLQLLMRRACSAGDVAQELGVPLARASYLLGTLQREGVAFVERTDPRAGRPVKRYRAAPRWFVPYEVTSSETLEGFWLTQLGPRMDALAALAARQLQEDRPVWGFWLSQGEMHSNLEIGDGQGPARDLFASDEPLMLTITALRLPEPQARLLKRRLLAVLKEAASWEAEKAPTYTLSLLLVRGGVE